MNIIVCVNKPAFSPQVFIEVVTVVSVLSFWVFGHKEREIQVLQPGTKAAAPALEINLF